MNQIKNQSLDIIEIAIEAAISGGLKIIEIYNKPSFGLKIKENNSPLTEADTAANKIIHDYLVKTDIPIISEEDKNLEYNERKQWKQCWIVDPLDGTKEFIKKMESLPLTLHYAKMACQY